MLQRQRRDPHVISGNGSALFAQLPINRGVMVSGLLVCVDNTNTAFQKKTAQNGFVVRSLRADGKTGPQLSYYNERQPDLIGQFESFDNGRFAPTEIGVTVGVQRKSHRHNSGSIVSCAAKASSIAGSFRHVFTISLRSR